VYIDSYCLFKPLFHQKNHKNPTLYLKCKQNISEDDAYMSF